MTTKTKKINLARSAKKYVKNIKESVVDEVEDFFDEFLLQTLTEVGSDSMVKHLLRENARLKETINSHDVIIRQLRDQLRSLTGARS